ncbi:MAG: hypothetical protein HQL95_08085 [Magnetococcales bacterium]|nr:hypothetical protein [Magnetococcales bacterium]
MTIRNIRGVLIGLVFLLTWSTARADVTLLVHGYLSGDDAWESSGVARELQNSGWTSGGRVRVGARGEVLLPPNVASGQRVFYLADLPSEAPLTVQADALKGGLIALRKQRGQEQTVLVGHSAGGVVARLLMVRFPELAIHTLITIASPHLGTDKAEVAGLVASTPLSMMAPMMGLDTLNRSRSLYEDLVRERPGNFLYWLNHQPHPKARYLSIIRQEGFAFSGDNTVPVASQDMARVAALKDQTLPALTIGQDHALSRQDGVTLARVLTR